MSIAIGFRTKSHVFVCSEGTVAESIIQIKSDEDRIVRLGNVLIGLTGRHEDSERLKLWAVERTRYLADTQRVKPSASMVAETLRRQLHQAIRSAPMECSSIVAGYDENGPEVIAIDLYGAVHEDNFVVSGYGLYFLFGIYDTYYRQDMSEEESLEFIQRCQKALKEHLYIKTSSWIVKSIDSNGNLFTRHLNV